MHGEPAWIVGNGRGSIKDTAKKAKPTSKYMVFLLRVRPSAATGSNVVFLHIHIYLLVWASIQRDFDIVIHILYFSLLS